MVDESKIALTPAVELSYLKQDEQRALLEMMEYEGATPSLSQAQRLRRMSQEARVSEEDILAVLTEIKSNQKEMIRGPVDDVRKFFRPGTSIKQMSETVVKAVEFYARHLERQRANRDAR
jgi:ParB family chromosome partitioning protein